MIGFVNQSEIAISLQSLSQELRGVKVRVYEGTLSDGLPFSEEIYHTFANKIRINVPRTFDRGSTENGSFLIQVESLWNDDDFSLFGQPKVTELVGYKSTTKPELDADSIKIYSSTGSENIISGRSGQNFKVLFENCPEQGELGLYYPGLVEGQQIEFQPCSEEEMILQPNLS